MLEKKIAIVGLGYVGLPLAYEFSKKYPVIGIDINECRVNELKNFTDRTNELSSEQLKSVLDTNQKFNLRLSSKFSDAKDYDVFIITVPTPIDSQKNPDLNPLKSASESIARILKKGDIIIYESTVYPGATEEICIPILEKISKLKFNTDFFVGYSPERINPGDKINTLTKIKKVVSGSDNKTSFVVKDLYDSIIENGTHLAPSIMVAEASKVIENAQRDLNISFMNELAIIFDKMGIDTNDVLEAASSKWNFLKFKPGLVGGHCISVDPYYLAHKSKKLGYYPDVIYSGRKVNESMPKFIADKVVRMLQKKGNKQISILILGATFKENCPDIRNSRVFDIKSKLNDYNIKVNIFDSIASPEEVELIYKHKLITSFEKLDSNYDAIILAVSHSEFKQEYFLDYIKKSDSLVFDVKGFLPRDIVDARL